MKVSVSDYLMGRDRLYPNELTLEIMRNAEVTVGKVNTLIAYLRAAGIEMEINPQTKTIISSGWRPPQINGQVKGAAVRSKHMTGEAVDLYDPEGVIDDYLANEEGALEALGVFMEHPSATKGWAHIQTVPPKSGRRIFYP